MSRQRPTGLAGPTVMGLLREAGRMARTQPVLSAVTIVMIAGMIVAVLLTSGRTVGAERDVLSTIDDAGTRAIVIRASGEANLTSDVIDRLHGIEGIASASAFGPVVDVTSNVASGGAIVGMRTAWGAAAPEPLDASLADPLGEVVWASPTALDAIGASAATGAVRTGDGVELGIAGVLELPEHLAFLDPTVLRRGDAIGAVSVLVVVADSPGMVATLADVVVGVLGVDDPADVTITTSESLADLRSLVQGQLSTFGRSLILGVLAVTGVLAATILSGLVMLRRRDFGRRRAIGASSSTIVALVLGQLLILAAIGVVVGTGASVAMLLAMDDPLPDLAFFCALAIAALATALAAGLVPALIASRRDPLTELRVP